jgi:chemotaxis signal transduction protein
MWRRLNMDRPEETEFLGAVTGTANIAVPIRFVKEVFETRLITRLPGTPGFIQGMVNMRGSIIPVLNPFKLPCPVGTVKKIIILKSSEGLVGLLITKLMDLFTLSTFDSPGKLPASLDGVGDCFQAMAKTDDTYYLFDADKYMAGTLLPEARKA